VGVSQTAAFNRGRHLYSAGRPSGWALAHISSCQYICGIVIVAVLNARYAVDCAWDTYWEKQGGWQVCSRNAEGRCVQLCNHCPGNTVSQWTIFHMWRQSTPAKRLYIFSHSVSEFNKVKWFSKQQPCDFNVFRKFGWIWVEDKVPIQNYSENMVSEQNGHICRRYMSCQPW